MMHTVLCLVLLFNLKEKKIRIKYYYRSESLVQLGNVSYEFTILHQCLMFMN